jgi:hypothetical protein
MKLLPEQVSAVGIQRNPATVAGPKIIRATTPPRNKLTWGL